MNIVYHFGTRGVRRVCYGVELLDQGAVLKALDAQHT